MSNLSLQCETINLTAKLQGLVDELQPEDPLKTWFSIELDTIGVREHDSPLSLDDTNARMRALDQLQYLIFRHKIRLNNPGVEGLERLP